MSPIEAALLVALLVLPFHFFIAWHLERQCDPRYLRERGVVIRREDILQDRAEPIGQYCGRAIYRSVWFMGMQYRFDRVVPPAYRSEVRRCELYLEPGLVYKTD